MLLLSKQQDIQNGKFDTSLVVAFLLPIKICVELYATSSHYAPIGINKNGFRVMVALQRGTNLARPQSTKDPMLWGSNKWLLAHPESPETKQGAYIGLLGENIKV